MFLGGWQHLIVIVPAAIISIVLHELAHGYVALWNGDPTAKINGRLSFNPIKHFDVFGFLLMISVGFGYARPVPINPYNFRHPRKGLFTVSIAGVTVNFALALIGIPLSTLCWIAANGVSNEFFINIFFYLCLFFGYLALINFSLMLFNLLPIFPLDGFRIVESLTYHTNKFCRFMRHYGLIILLVLFAINMGVNFLMGLGYADWLRYFSFFYWMGELRYYVMWPFLKFWSWIFGTGTPVLPL